MATRLCGGCGSTEETLRVSENPWGLGLQGSLHNQERVPLLERLKVIVTPLPLHLESRHL
jgi:hypothetical protein